MDKNKHIGNMFTRKDAVIRKALKTIGYTDMNSYWYVHNDCIPYYIDGQDMVLDFKNEDYLDLVNQIKYVQELNSNMYYVYAVAEDYDIAEHMPCKVFYITPIFKEKDLSITNNNNTITTAAVIGRNYENGWTYQLATIRCNFIEVLEEGNYILEIENGLYGHILADDRIK